MRVEEVFKATAKESPLGDGERFREALVGWFEREGVWHPWRETREPWAVLISEVMLQQTTVAAVRAGRRFERFWEEFGDLEVMAGASEEALLKAWEGLGYYNRVRNLQKTARVVLEEYGGRFPETVGELEGLPGVGQYTAGAIASFAFGKAAPIVDGNVARVLARMMDYWEPVDGTVGRRQLWEWAGELLDRERPREFNSGLMELGQTYCRPRKPDCLSCPVAGWCLTREPEELPVKKAKVKTVEVVEHALLARSGGRVLLAKEGGSRRRGFWRLPLRSEEEVADLEVVKTSKYAITKHRVTLCLYDCGAAVPGGVSEGEEWFGAEEIEALPMASPMRKALEAV